MTIHIRHIGVESTGTLLYVCLADPQDQTLNHVATTSGICNQLTLPITTTPRPLRHIKNILLRHPTSGSYHEDLGAGDANFGTVIHP